MSKPNKKQRHKSKRDAKKLAARRRNSISPIKRLADAKGEIECWKAGDFDENRQISFFVHKRAAGVNGVACFLVDRGVVGLKDAWCRVPIERDELDYMLSAGEIQGIQSTRCTVDEVRKVVAAGVRYAHDNGMRLPKDWVKVASIMGGVGDWASADVSGFSREFMGHPEDLRRRLIGEPFEDYVQRKDVTFLFNEGAPLMDMETGEYEETDDEEFDESPEFDDMEISDEELEETKNYLAPVAIGLAEETRQWGIARGQAPASELTEGWLSMLVAMMLSKASQPDGSDAEIQQRAAELLIEMAEGLQGTRREDFDRSIDQAMAHLSTDVALMQNAILKYAPADKLLEE